MQRVLLLINLIFLVGCNSRTYDSFSKREAKRYCKCYDEYQSINKLKSKKVRSVFNKEQGVFGAEPFVLDSCLQKFRNDRERALLLTLDSNELDSLKNRIKFYRIKSECEP